MACLHHDHLNSLPFVILAHSASFRNPWSIGILKRDRRLDVSFDHSVVPLWTPSSPLKCISLGTHNMWWPGSCRMLSCVLRRIELVVSVMRAFCPLCRVSCSDRSTDMCVFVRMTVLETKWLLRLSSSASGPTMMSRLRRRSLCLYVALALSVDGDLMCCRSPQIAFSACIE